ncbi:cyclic nucleotide-binding domain-containing protein [Nocardioides sp. AX2bis]|uniref:cyclic nucleotide-binding domain-containing protein n=1 Tax=Nocardioides sp. AX2bis TaxID=2653157 RepID=UPI0012F180A5|nr:cyclic nucleotide-binding domain-containing protein [Nocardioides sp. AX2bis]VXB02310.1 Cyclic nucleotide-binding domain-containing protein [Nocardioides sp. AX2bis]
MAKSDDVTARLTRVPRFADLSKRELEKVAKAGRLVHLPAQWSLMAETTPADKAYVLLAGTAEVRRQGTVVATVGAGDLIGEIGVLQKKLRTAAVVSTSELEVVHFTNEDLSRLAEEIPAFGRALEATAAAHDD